jgi:hypothetical protein
VQTVARGHLHGFEIQTLTFTLGRQHYLEEPLEFPCDFLTNRNSRFFSASVQPAASGSTRRSRQICSLMSVICAIKF